MTDDLWHNKAKVVLEKAKEQQRKTAENGGSSTPNIANRDGNGIGMGGREDILDKLCQMLEESMKERAKMGRGEEAADKRMRQHLGVYGTWTNGATLKALTRKKATSSNGTMGAGAREGGETAIIGGMDAIQENAKEEEHSREEPWRGSCQFSDIMEGMQQMEGPIAEDYEREPWPIRAILHLALFTVSIVYLLLGAQIFRWLDPEIGTKVFPKAFVWTFQLATTIGWGDSKATTGWSQAFTILYVLFAIPIIFSCFANLGRLATEFACIGWPRLKCWILRRLFVRAEDHHRLPLLSALNFLCLHQSIGIFIYSHWLKQWPVMGTVYYSITTMATIGFGDFHPDTDHWGETIVALLYLSTGVTLLSMLFLAIAFHYQTLHYEIFKDLIQTFYTNIWLKFKQYLREKRKEDEATKY